MKQLWSKEEIEALINANAPKLYSHAFTLTIEDLDSEEHSISGYVIGTKPTAYTIAELLMGVQNGEIFLCNTFDETSSHMLLITGISGHALDEQDSYISFLSVYVETGETIYPNVENTISFVEQDMSYTAGDIIPLK